MNKHLVIQIIPRLAGGGAEVLAQDIARKTDPLNFDSHVVSFSKGDFPVDDSAVINFNSGPRNFLNIFRLRRLLKKFSQQYEHVICHAHLTWPFYFTILASAGLRVSCIYTEHSTANKRRRIPLLKILDRAFYRKYEKIICISQAVKTSLLDWIGSALTTQVIENGVDLPTRDCVDQRSRNLEGLPVLVAVGSLRRAKGFDIAIRAVARIRDEIDCFMIVGEGPDRLSLEKLAKREGLQNKVKFLGWRSDTARFYEEADLQLVPSRWEGFGLVAVEGMGHGLPIVASNVEGLNEVVDPKQISMKLVDRFEDVESWVLAIKTVTAELRYRRNDLAVSSRSRAEKFSVERMVQRYEAVYDELNH